MKKARFVTGILIVLLSSCAENKAPEDKPKPQLVATSNPDSLTGKNGYVNPVDHKTYVTEGEYKDYKPQGGVIPVEGPVQPLQVILLTDQETIARVIDIETLANFIKGANELGVKQLRGLKEKGKIIVQFTLYAGKKANIGMSYDGNFKKEDLSAFFNKLELYSNDIRTQKDTCAFQCLFGINENQK